MDCACEVRETADVGTKSVSKLPVGEALDLVRRDVAALMAVTPTLLGLAQPPRDRGVYMLLLGDEIKYVGEANGSGGLRDRLKSKHLSGDDGHAIQRAFLLDHPDRTLRREHIKRAVSARWIVVDDPGRALAVEQLLIWMYDPEWNEKERKRRRGAARGGEDRDEHSLVYAVGAPGARAFKP